MPKLGLDIMKSLLSAAEEIKLFGRSQTLFSLDFLAHN
jgi:hypothetical protein